MESNGLLVLLAGLAILATWAWRLIHRATRLEFGERGILDRNLGLGWIRWDEIEGAYQRHALEQTSVFLRLRPTERILRRLGQRREAGPGRAGRSFDVRVDLTDADLTAVELVQEIMARGREAAPAPDRHS